MKQFKAESKRLLDLMINSIYTNKEIFLRELISNASDAIDKLYYKSLTDKNINISREDFFIKIDIDKENRILKISDNGIGMTEEELENNKVKITYTMEMETLAGKVTFANTVRLTKEDSEIKVVWTPNVIFPGLNKTDKIKIDTGLRHATQL